MTRDGTQAAIKGLCIYAGDIQHTLCMTAYSHLKLLAIPVLIIVGAAAPTARAESRGELLYSAHCVACHTTQVHWRDKKLATNWPSLQAQVQRWQGVAKLKWNDADILDVTRFLNESFYHFAQTPDTRISMGSATSVAPSELLTGHPD